MLDQDGPNLLLEESMTGGGVDGRDRFDFRRRLKGSRIWNRGRYLNRRWIRRLRFRGRTGKRRRNVGGISVALQHERKQQQANNGRRPKIRSSE